MKIVCGTKEYPFAANGQELDVILYGYPAVKTQGSAGAAISEDVERQELQPSQRAWDFLSLALSVTAADVAGMRDRSPDGWTRQLALDIAVSEPDFWNTQTERIDEMLAFLTTDIWEVRFVGGGMLPKPPKNPVFPAEDCVMLLSGGLDSFVGGIDLVSKNMRPFAVSQTVRGDAEIQRSFTQLLGGGLRHLQLNHNATVPNPENPPSQRARSLIFMAYGLLAATSLWTYGNGAAVNLYVSENGFISINPPLTGARLGSLSTRTTHPVFMGLLQELLDAVGFRVRIVNPYQFDTKGEMLRNCTDQAVLRGHAHRTTSCGRFKRFGYKHCGRCVPCLVRRAAFLAAGHDDATEYVYSDLGREEGDYSGFDDVRAIAMALAESKSSGLERWIGTALSTALLGDVARYQRTVERGLEELGALLKLHGVA